MLSLVQSATYPTIRASLMMDVHCMQVEGRSKQGGLEQRLPDYAPDLSHN